MLLLLLLPKPFLKSLLVLFIDVPSNCSMCTARRNFIQSRYATGHAMLDPPVPIQALKLSNFGPGQYLDGILVGAASIGSDINAA